MAFKPFLIFLLWNFQISRKVEEWHNKLPYTHHHLPLHNTFTLSSPLPPHSGFCLHHTSEAHQGSQWPPWIIVQWMFSNLLQCHSSDASESPDTLEKTLPISYSYDSYHSIHLLSVSVPMVLPSMLFLLILSSFEGPLKVSTVTHMPVTSNLWFQPKYLTKVPTGHPLDYPIEPSTSASTFIILPSKSTPPTVLLD